MKLFDVRKEINRRIEAKQREIDTLKLMIQEGQGYVQGLREVLEDIESEAEAGIDKPG